MRLSTAPESPRSPASSGRTSSATPPRVFRWSTLEQLGGVHRSPRGRRSSTAPASSTSASSRSSTSSHPDAIVEDNVCAFPAIPASGRPGARIVSCNPLEIPDPELPPPSPGCRSRIDHGWDAFRPSTRARWADLQASFSAFCVERGAPPLPATDMIHKSPWLNLYLYPRELDYPRSRPLGPHLAQPRHVRPHHRRSVDTARDPDGTATSSMSASGRWARPTWR